MHGMKKHVRATSGTDTTAQALKREIARLKRENEALRVNEDRYRALFEALPVSLQVVDRGGSILEVNPFHLSHMGKGRTTLSDYTGQDITARKSVAAAGLSREYKDVLAGVPFEKSEVLYPALSGGGEGWFNVRGVPLKKGEEILGAIYILEDVSGLKRAKDELILANKRLTGQMEEIRQLHSDLREQVIRDPLTALHNRRYLNETLDRELARASREQYHVALVMIDVDNFKVINDTHGHHVGDLVLKNLARQLRTQTRASDLVCRLGGDEFLVVLLNASAVNAVRRADQYRTTFEASAAVFEGVEVRATLSLGIAMFPDQGTTSREVMTAADRALYESKRKGRNRTTD
jgi:diguanylate cyclase (GGDEF)-like protein/PAS domain S-box-containing protein